MKKFLLCSLPFILLISFINPAKTTAQESLSNNEEVFQYLQEAFQAQVQLSEKPRTMEEIYEILSPYFSKEAMKVFTSENLFMEDGKYITYGTDFPIYYIPFFTYTDETKIVRKKGYIYVFEYFKDSGEGPVSFDDHYEGVIMKDIDGIYKVDEYLYDNIPEEIIQRSQQPNGSFSPVSIFLTNLFYMKKFFL